MVSYYTIHKGNLQAGDIAKASDINMIQQIAQDAIRSAMNDLTEGQSWILGTNDQSDKDSFVLTPETKRAGRYIDQMNLAEGDDAELVSIRETSFRQPIKLSRSSVYSIIVKIQNKSEKDIPIVFELHSSDGYKLPNMRTILTVPKHTDTPKEFEVVFDLDYYPTAPGIDPEDLEQDNPQLVNNETDEESDDSGIDYDGEEDLNSFSAGASIIYLYVEALNVSKRIGFDVNTVQKDGYKWNDTDPTFGIVMNKNSTYGQLLEESSGSEFIRSSVPGDLFFKEIYANSPTYKCNYGQAIVGGDKVVLADTHVSIGGASGYGDVISYVYMDQEGHLKAKNSDPFVGEEPAEPIPVSTPHLHIADIVTYVNDVKDPIVYQDDTTQVTRPRSHHERLRRLEKYLDYVADISVPSRFKYTLTGEDWIDENPNVDMTTKSFNGTQAQSIDSLNKEGYSVTTDENGNFIVKGSAAETFSIPITLKSETSGKIATEKDKTKIISEAQKESYIKKLAEDDITRAQTFAEIKNMKNDITNGTLTLETSDSGIIVATNSKEAKKIDFNPWDDTKANRPAKADVKPITRHYTINSGKNGANDWSSEFPAMTFYTDTGYKLKKLQIPIYKFKNCDGIKFIIWKRQGPNNKKNTVWLDKKIKTTKTFSLKNAKVKKGYQYMEDGFIIDFGKDGLKLSKGQYVIICLPVVKSGQGTVYVDTYKPKDSKDFCIRYYGAANASHFQLKERYQEIWYNPIKAQAEEIKYSKSGSIVSGVVSWKNKEAIKTVKPIANLTTPDKTKAKIYVDVGGGWKKVTEGKENSVIGSGAGDSFRWKIEFSGNSKDTPILKYDKKKKYAIKFEITRSEPSTSNLSAYRTLDNNLCLTSKVFDANEILKQYIGDANIGYTNKKFSNYEFARIWATDSDDKALVIDISASDRTEEVKNSSGSNITVDGQNIYYPVYSFHYVDLGLDDLPKISTDYNNYDPSLEEDEHNLRFKLDTENSYNDDEIKIVSSNSFQATNNSYVPATSDSTIQGLNIDLSKVPSSESNQVLAKAKLSNPIDLTKYSGIKLGIAFKGTNEGTISGLGLYISSQNEIDPPTNKSSEKLNEALPDGLPELDSSQEKVIEKYANQIVMDAVIKNGIKEYVYYKAIWNSEEQKWEWQQVHDLKSYKIYKIINRETKSDVIKLTDDNNGKEQFFEIDIDPNNVNLQYAKEIGLIALCDEKEYSRTNVDSLVLTDFKAIKKDYYTAFNASEGNVFKSCITDANRTPVTCKKHKSLAVPKTSGSYTETIPPTSSIQIAHQKVLSAGEDLCSFDMTSKSTENFNHIGIQIASDCLITKNMLELQLRKVGKDNEETTIETINLPTINYVYYSTTAGNKVSLAQVVKKIKTTEKFDKIVLVATNRFKTYAGKLKNVTDANPNGALGADITLYIGNITLYRAETFPMLYPMMRMKMYLDKADSISRDQIGIRKLGAIIEYQ